MALVSFMFAEMEFLYGQAILDMAKKELVE
jgi:hypothetical protein